MTQPVTTPLHAPTIARVLFFLGFICFLIAAIDAGTSLAIGPAISWIAGGFASWSLAWAVA